MSIQGKSDKSFNVKIDDKLITKQVDRDAKFKKNRMMDLAGLYWTEVEDEHLMVWYQMETLPSFYKLYGHIQGIMKKGETYQIAVIDNWDAEKIGNKKYIYLSEVGTFGGKSYTLAFMLLGSSLVVFIIMVVFSICYFAKLHKKNRDSDEFINSLKF